MDESASSDLLSEDQMSEDRERELRIEWNMYLSRLVDLPTPRDDTDNPMAGMSVSDSALPRPA